MTSRNYCARELYQSSDGIDVIEKPFNERNLFATIFSALGLDPYAEYDLPGLPSFHRVEEKAEPIREVLL